jgi:predicted esterase
VLKEGNWEKIELSPDSTLPLIDLFISFDNKALLIKASVKDNHFKDGEKSWRYGDGFYINFAIPLNSTENSSDKFYGFGFSRVNKKPVSVLVNKDGQYFPKLDPPPLPLIKIDSTDSGGIKAAEYLNRSWKIVYPFDPLKDPRAGINIVYSQTAHPSHGIQEHQMAADDNNYDTELTNFRKFIPLKFVIPLKSGLKIAGKLENRIIDGKKNRAKLWVQSPKNKTMRFRLKLSSDKDSLISEKYLTKRLKQGVNIFNQTITLPKKDGLFKINISINDSVQWEEAVIKYRPQRISQTPPVIELLSHTSHNKFIDFGCDVLNYHIEEIGKEIESFDDRKDIYLLQEKFKVLDSLIELFTAEKTILRSGFLSSAFRSIIDSTLQPFSLVLPENFDPAEKYDLLLVLHGSGVDEIDIAKKTAAGLQNENLIIAAPRGRDLSSWYTGLTEKDIIDLTHYLKILFRIDKTFLYGFSMGGYGVWRLGMLYPQMFSGGIVISGIPFNPREESAVNDMNNYLDKERKLDYLVIHGTNDNSLKINYTDSFIEKLKNHGYKIDYIRIDGAGHGNYSTAEYVNDWLKNNFEK